MSDQVEAAQRYMDGVLGLPYGVRVVVLDAFNAGWKAREEADDE